LQANTFAGLTRPCTQLVDFSDGVILEEILSQVYVIFQLIGECFCCCIVNIDCDALIIDVD
jgi:hypothetical protein